MGNYNCCDKPEHCTTTIDTGKEINNNVDKHHKISFIQKEWRKSKSSRAAKTAKIKVLEESLDKVGKVVPLEELERKTTKEIVGIEKTLSPFTGSEEDKKLLEPNLIMRKPFKYNIDGSLYHGFWNQQGLREGYGVYISNNGVKYEGLWKNGKLFKGRIYETDGTYYQGEIQDFLPHGQGSYKFTNGNIFSGQWSKGIQVGQGTRSYKNNSSYQGAFVDNMYEGNGKFTWSDRSTYEGEFIKGFMNGKGFYRSASGDTYQGSWNNNLPDGQGIYRTSNIVYTGNYKSGKKNGSGKLTWNNKYYDGEWTNDLPNGVGVYGDGTSKITGLWRYGKLIEVESGDTPKEDVVIDGSKGSFPKDSMMTTESNQALKKVYSYKPKGNAMIFNFIKKNVEANIKNL